MNSTQPDRRSEEPRIMVVDDEVIIVSELKLRMEAMGYDVVCTAASGQEAIDLAVRHQPDLILMDLVGPDGTEMGALLVVRDVSQLSRLEKQLKERHQFHTIIGRSQKMQKIYELMENLADTEASVLIMGESGTGKEVVAKALHFSSSRAADPLVKVNCAALSDNLLESEMFGHVRGAFTGAVNTVKSTSMPLQSRTSTPVCPVKQGSRHPCVRRD